MALVTICKYRRAKTPYFLEQAGLNMYSLEELAWFLYHNICLAEPQMFDDRLCRWLEEEIGSSELARRIRNGKESGTNFQNLVISIVGAVDLFTNQELAELGEQLKSLGTMQEQERLKLRADGLLNSRNEWAAAEEYRRILRMHQNTRLGVEFYAAVWNNLGICYVRQFLFERAVECFETSMQFAPHEDTRKYRELAEQLAADYGVTVLPVSCEQLKKEDIFHILESVLKEFPVTQLDFHIPKWLEVLPATHWLKTQVIDMARELLKKVSHMKDAASQIKTFGGSSGPVEKITIEKMEMADGTVSLQVQMDDSYYYQILSDYVGLPIEGEYQLMQTLSTLAGMQKEYDKVKEALAQARLKGYGVMMPQKDEILLDEPEVIRHGNKYGVKMKAQAPSVNLIRAQIETEIAPIVGSEQQAKDLIAYIKSSSKDSEEGIWNANIFGKSIEQIVEDGIQAKISQMTDECQQKLQDTLQKIINDSNGGMICIII